MIDLLNDEDHKRPFSCKMMDTVQSYDLLQNEKYSQLQEFKANLDRAVVRVNLKKSTSDPDNQA